ncbi:MAG: hypothetical protein JNJ99_03305, partial [Crocinitomicaceae bacterium]|nr:hypothetical protein [Crocinitomicaceae bacterium]
MTYWGGISNLGTLYEYDILTDVMIKKMDFTGVANGSYPEGGLIEITVCTPEYQISESATVCYGNSFNFPDGYIEYNITSDMTHTSYLQTVNTCDSIITTSITVVTLNNTVLQNLTFLSSSEVSTNFLWLDCDDNYSVISGAVSNIFAAPTIGNYALRFDKNGCIDTSFCIYVDAQDFYDSPGYLALSGNVFPLPVSNIDTCDAIAYAFTEGGIAPYTYEWFTQPNNGNTSTLDSLCEGFHTLKITDNIGDTTLVNFYVTDTANYFNWYDTTYTGFVDTLYIDAPNCILDYSIPLDSAFISQFYYLSPDTIPPGDLYFIEISYYQSGTLYL